MSVRIVEMTEGRKRIVEHRFYGRNPKEARHNERAHRRADKSLDAALRKKTYRGIKIRATRKRT